MAAATEGVTGDNLAGLFDLDMTSITHLARSGIVVGSGVRGRYLLAPLVGAVSRPAAISGGAVQCFRREEQSNSAPAS